MVVSQRDIYWADLSEPIGSGPGYRRPVVVVQGDSVNRSRIATVVCVPLTTNMRWKDAPGNVFLSSRSSGLDKDSVANVSQIISIDRGLLRENTGRISLREMELILIGIDVILGK